METSYIPKIPNEETLSKFFPSMRDHLHLVLNNKYFYIEKKKKQVPRQTSKGKLSKTEWFENLELDERVEAISTISTDNFNLIEAIRSDIKKLENKNLPSKNINGSKYSQEEEKGSSQISHSQNWTVYLAPELPN